MIVLQGVLYSLSEFAAVFVRITLFIDMDISYGMNNS